MELLETQDPEKRKLIETSDRHKHELQKEIKSVSDKTENTLKNALIIGGVLVASYLLVSAFSTTKKKRKTRAKSTDSAIEVEDDEEESPTVFSQIGAKIADTATIVLSGSTNTATDFFPWR